MIRNKSTKKRARQSIKRHHKNSSAKKEIKTHEKKLLQAINKKENNQIPELFKIYNSKMDKAARKGIIHYKKASRKISQFSLKANIVK